MYSNLLLISFLIKEEMIQTADGAAAKMVQFFAEHRHYDYSNLVNPFLGHFLEPSLITANKMLCSPRKIGKECRIYKGALRQVTLSKLVS